MHTDSPLPPTTSNQNLYIYERRRTDAANDLKGSETLIAHGTNSELQADHQPVSHLGYVGLLEGFYKVYRHSIRLL